MTCDTWHMTHRGRWTFSPIFRSLAHMVLECRCFEDLEQHDGEVFQIGCPHFLLSFWTQWYYPLLSRIPLSMSMVNILNFTNPDFLSAKLRLHTSRPVGLSDFPGEELPTCKDQVKQSCYNVKVLGWRNTQGANNQATNIFKRFWYPWTFTHLRIVCFTHPTQVLLCPWGFSLRSGRGCSMCEISKQKLCKKSIRNYLFK